MVEWNGGIDWNGGMEWWNGGAPQRFPFGAPSPLAL